MSRTAANRIQQDIILQVPSKLVPVLAKPKRLKIVVGGRGGGKSWSVGDAFLKMCDDGERLCAAREFMNSIDDSVHALLKERLQVLQPDMRRRTLSSTAKAIVSHAGGEVFYRGLARNPDSLRSMFGVQRLWVEEGQTLSETSLDIIVPTIREADSEIWITMNRGSSKDPVSRRLLKRAERALQLNDGYYEDDDMIVVEINWQDNPWFPAVLDADRRRDKVEMDAAKYAHIWEGAYSDTVSGAIITPEMFDACVDAHLRLGWQPVGIEVVSFDPAGGASGADNDSNDAKALCYRRGNLIDDVVYRREGDVNDGADFAIAFAVRHKVDEFIWDGDGLGMGLRRQFADATLGKRIVLNMFRGGMVADHPTRRYEPIEGEGGDAGRTNQETFFNKRAQYYWMLRDRMMRTYRAVTKGVYSNPADMISISSGIKDLAVLRSEICSIPEKANAQGRFQIMSKEQMKSKLKLDSPNGADAVMMSLSDSGGRRPRSAEAQNWVEHTITDMGAGY